MKSSLRIATALAAPWILVLAISGHAAGQDAKPDTKPKPMPTPSLDEGLLDDLTDGGLFEGLDPPASKPADRTGSKKKGESPGDGDVKRPAGEDIGEGIGEENPLVDLSRRMRRIESRLAGGETGGGTQRMQQEIVRDLAKLIELARQASPSAGGKKSPDPKNRPKKGSHGAQPKAGTGTFEPNPKAKDSDEGVRKAKPTDPKPESMIAVRREVWGRLPPHVQEALAGGQAPKVLFEYADEVKEYFSRLAELYQDQENR